jgi:hypothetical protein
VATHKITYYQNFYSTQLNRYQIPKLKQDQKNHLNNHKNHKETEAVTKCLPTTKRPDCVLFKLFNKIERECTLLNLFNKATIVLIPKANRPNKERELRPIFLLNIDSKVLNKITN